MSPRIARLSQTAYHEAGHAVAAYLQRRRVLYVTIVPEPENNTLGHCALRRPPGWSMPDASNDCKTRARAESQIIISLAGHAAVEALKGRPARQKQAGSWADWDAAISLAANMTGSPEETEAYLNWLWARTADLIRLPWNWAAVHVLAYELLKQHRIGERRARAIISEAIRVAGERESAESTPRKTATETATRSD